MQGVRPGSFPWPTGRQGESQAVADPLWLGGHEQDLVSQRLERGRLVLGRQTEPLNQLTRLYASSRRWKYVSLARK